MNIKDSEHILSNLKKENLNLEPFPYFNFDSFFSKTYYEDLISMKPLDEQFEKTIGFRNPVMTISLKYCKTTTNKHNTFV